MGSVGSTNARVPNAVKGAVHMIKSRCSAIEALLWVFTCTSALVAAEAQNSNPADWPTYNHDPAGWRFNPIEKTLSTANVGKLVEKWRFPPADSKEIIGVVHATPTVVAGEVYFGTATF